MFPRPQSSGVYATLQTGKNAETDYDRTPTKRPRLRQGNAGAGKWGHNAGDAQERDEGVQETAQTHRAG